MPLTIEHSLGSLDENVGLPYPDWEVFISFLRKKGLGEQKVFCLCLEGYNRSRRGNNELRDKGFIMPEIQSSSVGSFINWLQEQDGKHYDEVHTFVLFCNSFLKYEIEAAISATEWSKIRGVIVLVCELID